MSTASLVDYLSEKFYSLSSKMWGDTVQPSSSSFLMNKSKNFQPYDLSALLPEVKDKSDYPIEIHPSYQFLPFLRFASGLFGGLGQLKSLDKPNYLNEKGFSPALFNFVSDTYYSKYRPSDSSIIPSNTSFLSLAKERFYSESNLINQQTESMAKHKVNNPQVTEMSLDIQLPPKQNSQSTKKNCDISRSVKFNKELAHRKTKEMSKRSKKRRRRQKKSEQLNSNNSTSDDEDINNECLSSVSDSICILSQSPDFECLSVTHSVQLSPRNSFFISVTNDSEDDSEWESFDELELSAANNIDSSEIKSSDSSTFSSSPLKSENVNSNCFNPPSCSYKVSSIISFIVPECDSSDDSDWDTCETGSFPDNTDLEYSGLYFTNLCVPQTYYKSEYKSNPAFEEDCAEILQIRANLFKANKQWNSYDTALQKPKSISKVTFAHDDDLVKVYPVEEYERKGEWEVYATERLRFKKRIDELEKIIAPCLKPEHRYKIFKKLVQPEL